MQLPCICVNTKRVLIVSLKRIGQCIPTIGIRGLEGSADVCARSRVLCDGKCDPPKNVETRFLIDIGHIDRDGNAIAAAIGIRNRN